MARTRLEWWAAVVLAALCARGHAADAVSALPLDELLNVEVSGASRFLQPLADAPASVTVISAEEIRRFGFRTLGEALQSAPGVYATSDRDYTFLGVRGFGRPGDYNSRILVLADGVSRNDPIYNQATVGNESPLELDWVKQLEFAPGPASALYGGNALFGTANAVLWTGADIDGTRLSTTLESGRGVRLGLLSGGRSQPDRDWVFGLAVSQQDGWDPRFREFAVPGVSDGVAHGLDAERYLKAFAKLSVGEWQFSANLASRRKNVPTAYYGTPFDTPGNYSNDRSAYLDVSHARSLAPDWAQHLRVYGGSYSFIGQYVFPGALNRDEARARWWGLDYRLSYSGLPGHRLMFGAEAQATPRLDQRNLDVSPRFDYLDDKRSGRSGGIYVQDEWRLASRWTANLGLRLDRLKDFATIASPRLALIHQAQADTVLKLLYGRAFRPPNAYERFYDDGNFTQKANPDLKPERIVTAELALEHRLHPDIQVGGSYYHYRVDKLIDQVVDPADGLFVFVNSSPVHARGIELETEAMLGAALRLKASVAWQRLTQPGGEPVNSPRRLGKLFLDGPLFATGWTLGLDIQAIAARRSLAGAVAGYASGNLTLRRSLPGRSGEVSLGIRNLAGNHYLDPAPPGMVQDALPRDGRQFSLRWDVSL